MGNKLRLTIVSQEEKLFDQEVDALTLPTANGLITILKDHQPLISKLAFGEMSYQIGNQKSEMLITQGFVNKKPDNQVLVVVDSAFNARELNDEKIKAAIAKAKEAYKISKDKKELLMIETSLKQLFWELQLANKKKKS
jgi:F-type H+-transporting ATPase subunit epsilon